MIADTIKGKGIRLIEHTNVMKKIFIIGILEHSDELYIKMVEDVIANTKKILKKNKLTFNPFKVLKSKNSYNKYISIDIH